MSSRDELIKKQKNSKSFKRQLQKAQRNYLILKQRTIYSQNQYDTNSFITYLQPKVFPNIDLYFINASYQTQNNLTMDRLALYFVAKIPKPQKFYSIVFVNDEENSSAFSEFKDMLEVMPFAYFRHLERIFLIKPTFSQKAGNFFSFATIPKFLNSRTDIKSLIDETNCSLKQLQQCPFLRIAHNHKKQINRNAPKTQLQSPQQKLLKIQAPLSFQINQYELGPRGIPVIFQTLVYYFKQHPQALKIQGLFRKSANIEQQKIALSQMSRKTYTCLQKIQNPHIVANLIKRFLSELSTPIISYSIFYTLMDEPELTATFIATQVKELGNQNKTKLLTLMFLLQFLQTAVIKQFQFNKMNAHNISVCFAPCLMKSKQLTVKEIVYAKKSVEVLEIMINCFEQIFGSKKDQMKLYRSSYFEHRKKSLTSVFNSSSEKSLQRLSMQNQGSPQIIITQVSELKIERTKSQMSDYWSEEGEDESMMDIKLNIHSTKRDIVLPTKKQEQEQDDRQIISQQQAIKMPNQSNHKYLGVQKNDDMTKTNKVFENPPEQEDDQYENLRRRTTGLNEEALSVFKY